MRNNGMPYRMIAFALLLVSAPVSAQTGVGSIAGTARDVTGAVLPGVTVEASSPALIEKVRAVVTDDQGNYKILELRPGTYAVTFTLPGFATFRREGIQLTTGFTATVNGEMKVGGLEETVTVTGASPVVDVQNARTQNVISDELLRTLPAGGKSTDAFAALTVGARIADSGGAAASMDVGGSRGETGRDISIHGSAASDLKRQIDGMNYNMSSGDGGGSAVVTFRVSTLGMQESVFESGGMAETETNAQINLVPKDGGNRFRLSSVAAYTDRNFQATNLTDTLRARGATTPGAIRKIWDYGLGIGGPIVTDRLWFYSANRAWGVQTVSPGAFWNKTQDSFVYTPDTAREGYEANPNKDFSGRFAWQASAKHKLTMMHFYNRQCACQQFVSAVLAPEAAFANEASSNFSQITWTYPATSRLLFTAGATFGFFPITMPYADGVTPESISLVEQATGLQFNAQVSFEGAAGPSWGLQYGEPSVANNHNQRFAVAYVTGSHAFKAGMFAQLGKAATEGQFLNGAVRYFLRNGVPVSLNQYVSPYAYDLRTRSYGVFVQDQWTLRRLTLNYGVRFDQFTGFVPATTTPIGMFTESLQFPEVKGIPNFKDISPRVSAAYDVFGNGKTAIKGSWNRYLKSQGTGGVQLVAPVFQTVRFTNRLWNDVNGNRIPDCDLRSPNANGECQAMANRDFGNPRAPSVFPADDVTTGWDARIHNWQGSVVLQQELMSGVGLTVGYYRTEYFNLTVTDNRTVTPQDYDAYCVTTPVDARLPGGGGQQLCGLYNLNPSKFGQPANSLITQSNHYPGEHEDRFDGVDFELTARFERGARLGGGASFASQRTFNCKIIDSPEQGRPEFCDSTAPWSYGTAVKLHGSYPLPWGIEASAVLQNLPGFPILANLVATNAQIAPSLGRNLAGCPTTGVCNATVSIPIVQPFTMFEDRPTQLDIRLTKIFRIGTARVKGLFDIYNLTNDAAVLSQNRTYGAAWLRPTVIHQARLFKFGVEIEY